MFFHHTVKVNDAVLPTALLFIATDWKTNHLNEKSVVSVGNVAHATPAL